jgi:uncharacterized membrane protein SpoIIM required for sporulation
MVTTADNLLRRRQQWHQLEQILQQLGDRGLRRVESQTAVLLSDLYRSACADLAMADQYRLSPETVNYLHGLVGRAHNRIYRSGKLQYQRWFEVVFVEAPRQIFRDPCVHICSILFFGLFSLSAYVAWNQTAFPGAAERILGPEQIEQVEQMYAEADFGEDSRGNLAMVGFYIMHNTGIGLKCFAKGVTIVPGLWETAYNATVLGATFGYMARPDSIGGSNLLHFVTAHGAFELSAIALAAAAGLRIGMGWIFTKGLTRLASLQVQTVKAVPVMFASGMLFFLAAMTEGLISPSSAPYILKALIGMFSSGLLMFYFVILGYPAGNSSGT